MNIKIFNAAFLSLFTLQTLASPALGMSVSNPSLKDAATSSQAIGCNAANIYLPKFLEAIFSNSPNADLDTKEHGWYFKMKGNGIPPDSPKETKQWTDKYDCYHLGDSSRKVLYLTFDEGYENGYTPQILDTLKKHNVKAAFFVVKPYITSNPDIIKRMVEEGHLVCNHSNHHPSMPSITNEEKFNKELSDVEVCFEEVTGKKMPKYFRPPMGKYSELSLYYTQKYGYKTIFWSFAYKDWEIKNQPSEEDAKKIIFKRTHNGAIILLHAVSKTNAEILDSVLTEWKNQGYTIETLDQLTKTKGTP